MRALLLLLAATASAIGQSTPIATIPTADADITTTVIPQPIANLTTLSGPTSLTAHNHTANLTLTRGGDLHLCQTTTLHLTPLPANALLLALDRGALELHTQVTPADTLLTPDLRLTPATPGNLELEIHVARNGDTCIENHGRHAPILNLTDAFGQANYQLHPNQHVLFEHGSLREVVDHETTPCGCPPPDPPVIPLAEALLRGGATVTPAQAAAAHPFPTAVSEGLAPPTPLPPQTPGLTHIQVSTTLTYDPTLPTPPPAPPRKTIKPFHAIGQFFKRLFVR